MIKIAIILLTIQQSYKFIDFSVDCPDCFERSMKPDTTSMYAKEIEAIEVQWDNPKNQFACKYSIISWGCGTGCQSHVIYNLESGLKVGSFSSTYGIEFEKYSRLIRINSDPIHKTGASYYSLDEDVLVKLK